MKLSDTQAKVVLLKWSERTSVWGSSAGRYWLRGIPSSGTAAYPTMNTPGASDYKTQPDGLYIWIAPDRSFADVICVESCGTGQNLNDKRSRYTPSSHSIVVTLPAAWLQEQIATTNKGKKSRWNASGFTNPCPTSPLTLPIRHLRVLYALEDVLYKKWTAEHIPCGHEYFCSHSSFDSFKSQKMQKFLKQLGPKAQIYT